MTTIQFYKYTGERNRMNKTLGDYVTVQSNFNIEYNLINPSIKIAQSEIFDYNYCYIPEIDRYYFIDRVNIRRGGFFELYLTLDVLQTYHDKILALYGTVTQSQNTDYLNGANIPVKSQTQFKKYEFNDVFNHDGTYVMITSGYIGSSTEQGAG